ncbi:hypothetical protein KAZ57_01115, partial [Patescibacteria group bacterium]|nr:hypothetical protein [Patescibacteria group bacterium]
MPRETPFDPEFINAIITGDPISSGKGLENTEPVRAFAEEDLPEDVIEDLRASKLPKTNPFTHSLSDANSREKPP